MSTSQAKNTFNAYGVNGSTSVYADSPRAAALAFFEANPARRKCNIVAGVIEGAFFTVSYGCASNGEWPESYRDVSRAQAESLRGN
jgi:hypothetical protein